MAKDYLLVDREQAFLLPPDMRDWLPRDHQVYLLIDVVKQHLDTSAFHARSRLGGAGRAGHDPDMLLTLLIWSYAQGVRSSRQIERRCRQDLSFRIICAGPVPDHTRIARFRADLAQPVAELFTQVLKLCARLGMGVLGTVTLDGTKVTANASKAASRGGDWLAEHARRAVAEHAGADAGQDVLWGQDRPDVVPASLVAPAPGEADSPARRRGQAARAARIARAYAQVQAEEAERAEQERAGQAKAEEYRRKAEEGTVGKGKPPSPVRLQAARAALARAEAAQQKKIDAWEALVAARGGRPPRGWRPQSLEDDYKVGKARERLAQAEAYQAARDQDPAKTASPPPLNRNITDPDSRLMPTRNGFEQAYNAQNVVSADGLILATDLGQTPGDVAWLQPMMARAEHAAALVSAGHAEHAGRHGLPCTCQHGTGPAKAAGCRRHPGGIGILVADAGYLSRDNLTAPGPDRLIAVGKHRDLLAAASGAAAAQTTAGATTAGAAPDGPDEADPIAAMAQRLRTPEGIATYNQRGHIAETPHGHIKHNLGFRQLSMRGLTKARAEWTFVCAVANLLKALAAGPSPLAQTGS